MTFPWLKVVINCLIIKVEAEFHSRLKPRAYRTSSVCRRLAVIGLKQQYLHVFFFLSPLLQQLVAELEDNILHTYMFQFELKPETRYSKLVIPNCAQTFFPIAATATFGLSCAALHALRLPFLAIQTCIVLALMKSGLSLVNLRRVEVLAKMI